MRSLVNRAGLRYFAVFTGAALLGAVVATAWVPPQAVVVVGTPLWIGALIAAALLPRPGGDLRVGLLAAAWLVAALLMFLAPALLWATVLGVRGERVEATVTAIEGATKRNRHLYYHLTDPAGTPIPGVLGRWPGEDAEGAVGARVTVVRDPGGLVDPRLPVELDEILATGLLVTPLVLAALAWLCGLAGRPRQVPEVVSQAVRAVEADQPAAGRRPARRRRRPGRPPRRR
ncbi:hypothetical protein ACQP00_29745 [Dactylosporangium sp. CS-047395]|uniref:hypothetical protein n=1 Tax=Dactylosporangium sp. CS-047395 TaxID=3239936 RepID=UPI003D8E1035